MKWDHRKEVPVQRNGARSRASKRKRSRSWHAKWYSDNSASPLSIPSAKSEPTRVTLTEPQHHHVGVCAPIYPSQFYFPRCTNFASPAVRRRRDLAHLADCAVRLLLTWARPRAHCSRQIWLSWTFGGTLLMLTGMRDPAILAFHADATSPSS